MRHPGAVTAVLATLASAGALVAAPATAGANAATTGAAATPVNPAAVSIVESVPSANVWLTPQPGLTFTPAPPAAGTPEIAVNDAVSYQVVQGFGAAMTDSSAWLIQDYLDAPTRAALLSELFGPDGIHLNFVRVPIGASDYTATGIPYTYDDLPPGQTDPTLAHFSIKHDLAYILPALRQVLGVNASTELLASPWTAPAWMKRNDALSNVGNKGKLLAKDYGVWAQYIVKFLQAYAAQGIDIGAVTPQNEPGNPTSYPGMNISPNSLATWTDSDLVPALRAAHLTTQVFGFDLGWGQATVADDLAAGETTELSGIAWHCYYGSPDVMQALHTALPGVSQIVDECSPGITPIPTSEVVIGSLRNWASTVALWNLALNRSGGPVQRPNKGCPGCYGLGTVVSPDVVWLTPAYFELGQASIAIQPGAHIVSSSNFVQYNYMKPGTNFVSPSLDDVAAVNPDGSHVLLAYNNGATPISFAVVWDSESFNYTLAAGATVTFEWDQGGAAAAAQARAAS